MILDDIVVRWYILMVYNQFGFNSSIENCRPGIFSVQENLCSIVFKEIQLNAQLMLVICICSTMM